MWENQIVTVDTVFKPNVRNLIHDYCMLSLYSIDCCVRPPSTGHFLNRSAAFTTLVFCLLLSCLKCQMSLVLHKVLLPVCYIEIKPSEECMPWLIKSEM